MFSPFLFVFHLFEQDEFYKKVKAKWPNNLVFIKFKNRHFIHICQLLILRIKYVFELLGLYELTILHFLLKTTKIKL